MTTLRAWRASRIHTIGVAALGVFLTAPSLIACRRAVPSASADARAESPAVIQIDGHERLEWDQAGKSLDEIRSYRYILLLGKTPREMKDVRCEARSPKGPFVCSAGLPPMDRGVHQVRVVAVAKHGPRTLHSPWSAPLLLEKR